MLNRQLPRSSLKLKSGKGLGKVLVSNSDNERDITEPHENIPYGNLKEVSHWNGLHGWHTSQEDFQPSSDAFISFCSCWLKEEGLHFSHYWSEGQSNLLSQWGIGPRPSLAQFWKHSAKDLARPGRYKLQRRTSSKEEKKEICNKKAFLDPRILWRRLKSF